MAVSEQQLAANQANAVHSTGPISINGKAVASRNAKRHGILSSRLVLEDEDPQEFRALLLELHKTLGPVGMVELALIERIAVTMWRQRRLVEAETASLWLARQAPKIAAGVSQQLGQEFRSELTEDELLPFDAGQTEWCRGVVDEFDRLEQTDFDTLPAVAPLIHAQLKSDADSDGETIEVHVKGFENGLIGYIAELALWCRGELAKADQRPMVLAVAEHVRSKRLVLPSDVLELFTRYQTTLDNQLYKSLRALREAQEWRLKSLDISPAPQGEQHDEAA